MIQSKLLAWLPYDKESKSLRTHKHWKNWTLIEETSVNTLTASKRLLTGSCSWAQGFLKCWSESFRELTISPCMQNKKWIQRLADKLFVRQRISIKPSTTFESTRHIFFRVSSTGALVCKWHMKANKSIKNILNHYNINCFFLHVTNYTTKEINKRQ